MSKIYGVTRDGKQVVPPEGWRILSEGETVPSVHREFIEGYDGRTNTWSNWWCDPRRCRSTMTPHVACVWGWVIAFAVPKEIEDDKPL